MHHKLIIGYLEKTLTPQESDEFYDWINSAPENKQLFFDAKMIYDASHSSYNDLDIEQSWERLVSKKNTVKRSPKLRLHLLRYAAAVFIGILASSLVFYLSREDNHPPVAQYVGGNGIEADMVILPDGTKVSMGAKTLFSYAPDYGRDNRVVFLEGEALFDVAHRADKPFIVKVNGQEVEALGTRFNVTAYANDSLFTTTLLEGKVRLMTHNLTDTVVLMPDQQLVYNRNKQSLKVHTVDAAMYTSWAKGYYYFPDQPFEAIVSRLSNLYGVDFEIKSDKLKSRKFTGTFYRGQSIKDILEIINISIPIKYNIEETLVTIN